MNNRQTMEGGCACGEMRYRLNRRPLFVHCCHCTWCQKESGSAFAINALIETREIEILKGKPGRAPVPTASGSGQVFLRCEACRIALWSHYSGMGEKIAFVRAGTLDDPSWAPPDIHIFTSTKAPWVTLPAGVPAKAEYYRRSDEWPAESLARRKAVLEI